MVNEISILNNKNQEDKISSLELAELCNKRHADVMRDIKNMEPSYLDVFGQERKFALQFKTRQLPNGGSKKDPFYSLTKSQSLFVVSSYSPIIRAKIQKRWEDLENERVNNHNLPGTYVEALESLLITTKENVRLNKEVCELNKEMDSIVASEPIYSMEEVAKIVFGSVLGRNKLIWCLREMGCMQKKHVRPYQSKIEMGLFIYNYYPKYGTMSTTCTKKGLRWITSNRDRILETAKKDVGLFDNKKE